MYRLNQEQQRVVADAAAVADATIKSQAAQVDADAAFPQQSIAATCGDASSNSSGRPIENRRRPIETRATSGSGAVTRREKAMVSIREPLLGGVRPGALDLRERRSVEGWRDAPRERGYQVKPEPTR